MANIYEFEGVVPVIHESAFVHPTAVIIGNVVIGMKVYIGPGAVLRGDFGAIVIEDGCNVQENCVVHMFPGVEVRLEENAHIGHGAIIHGAHIGQNCLVGMNAVIMDRVHLGRESIVGALTLVPADMQVPERSLIVGSPGKIIKQVTDEMMEWKSEGTAIYQTLPARYKDHLKPCEPLREVPKDRFQKPTDYKTWNQTKMK